MLVEKTQIMDQKAMSRAITRIFKVSIALAKNAIKLVLLKIHKIYCCGRIGPETKKSRRHAQIENLQKHGGSIRGRTRPAGNIQLSGRITNPQWAPPFQRVYKSPPYNKKIIQRDFTRLSVLPVLPA